MMLGITANEALGMTSKVALTLRPARSEDALPLLEWQKHPQTRKYARNPTVPSDDEHIAWFARKLADSDCRFYFAEQGGHRVGMLRLDHHHDEWEISIVVAPEMRSQGIGKAILGALGDLTKGDRLVAEALPDNSSSHSLFRSAGFRLCGDGLYRKP